MYCYSGWSCEVRTIEMQGGAFKSDFQPSTITKGAGASRRRLQESPSLVNPIICLQLGESMVFDIEIPEHYPVYLKDSLLNSNLEFDYGPFLELEELIEDSGQNITSYAYTFREAGRYAFADQADENSILLISVMNTTETCPEPYMRERAAFTLTKMDVNQEEDVNVATDWRVYLFILSVIIVFLGFLTAIQVFRNRARKRLQRKMRQQAAQEMKKMNAEIKVEDFVLGDTPGARKGKTSILDPEIFQAMYNRLLDLNSMLKQRATKQEEYENTQIQTIMSNLKGLKDIILGKINPELVRVVHEEVQQEEELVQPVAIQTFDTHKELDFKQIEKRIKTDP